MPAIRPHTTLRSRINSAIRNGAVIAPSLSNSITAAGRLCFAWSSQQPEAFSDRTGKKDLRGAFGLHAREMIGWLMQLQQARGINVVFLGVLETVTDDFNRTEHRLQMEGARTGRELPAIIDQVITYTWVDFGDGALARSFVCTSPNTWNYPAKDRSGRLDQFEPPDLGRLLTKLTKPAVASPFIAAIHEEKETSL